MYIVDSPDGLLLVMMVMVGWLAMTGTFNIDTRPITAQGPTGSYFGFSVGLLHNNHGTWLLVGAPRANSTLRSNISEPGALIKCLVRKGQATPCVEVILDKTGNIWHSDNKYQAIKEKQWLGGSFDVRPGLQDQVVVCAHAWRDSKYTNFHYLANGFCFLLPGSLDETKVKELLLLLDPAKQVDQAGRFKYGMALAGFSTHYTQDGMLLLGAPGLRDSTGGFLAYTENKHIVMESFTDDDGYLGYAMNSGRFYGDGEEYYVVGGPNVNDVGKVYILDRNFTILQQFSGNQIRCQFGAALAIADLNDDGFDDVIIGAPYYRALADEGRAFIYINEQGVFSEKVTLTVSGSNSMSALFGSSMATLGDINRDGYVDIVIGAPYENDMRGAIYIYNGYPGGLRSQYSQRIAADELGDGYRGFGISFSRPMDVDRNGYDDFAVGSYVSDHAVILKSIPVADVVVKMDITPALIDLSMPNCEYRGQHVTCIVVTACFYYHGFWVPKTINIEYMIRSDTLDAFEDDTTRVELLIGGGLTNVYLGTATLKYSANTCRTFTAIAHKSRDFLTPVRFELSYDLLDTAESLMNMLRGKPGIVLNRYQDTDIYSETMFAHECGADNICQENLHLVTGILLPGDLSYVIAGEDTVAEHRLVVSNTGEPAYLAKIIIEYPIQIQYIRTVTNNISKEILCSRIMPQWLAVQFHNITLAAIQNDTYMIVCDVGNPMLNGTSQSFTISIVISGTDVNIQSLNIRLWANSLTSRMDRIVPPDEDYVSDVILVRPKSTIVISGYSEPEEIMLSDAHSTTISGVTASWHKFAHVYIVQNVGPSAYPAGSMTFTSDQQSPVIQDNIQFVEAMISVPFYERDTTCQVVNTAHEHRDSRVDIDNAEHRQFVDVKIVRKRRQIIDEHTETSANNSCRSPTCLIIYCSHTVMQMDAGFTVKLAFRVSSSICQDAETCKILLQTRGEVQRPADPLFLSDESASIHQVSTLITESDDVVTVDIWLIVASGVSSLMALLLIIALLWKAGFFRRKRRDDLLKLLGAESARESVTTTDLPDGSYDSVVQGRNSAEYSNDVVFTESNDIENMFMSVVNARNS